jgi:hypothetical protein
MKDRSERFGKAAQAHTRMMRIGIAPGRRR